MLDFISFATADNWLMETQFHKRRHTVDSHHKLEPTFSFCNDTLAWVLGNHAVTSPEQLVSNNSNTKQLQMTSNHTCHPM